MASNHRQTDSYDIIIASIHPRNHDVTVLKPINPTQHRSALGWSAEEIGKRKRKKNKVENSGFGIFRNLTAVFHTSPLLSTPPLSMLPPVSTSSISIPSNQHRRGGTQQGRRSLLNPLFLFTRFLLSSILVQLPLFRRSRRSKPKSPRRRGNDEIEL